MNKNKYGLNQGQSQEGLFGAISRLFQIDVSLSKGIHVRFLPEMLFLSLLCLIYIGNRHYAEKKSRAIGFLEVEVENLRVDYTTLKADFMYESKQSEVAKRAKSLGLKESNEFPILIQGIE